MSGNYGGVILEEIEIQGNRDTKKQGAVYVAFVEDFIEMRSSTRYLSRQPSNGSPVFFQSLLYESADVDVVR